MNSILDAPVATEQKFEYAGFWIRVVATIIDGIVLWVVNMIISFALIGGSVGMGMASGGDYAGFGMMIVLTYLIMLGIQISYFALLESSSRQATLGKMAVGIKVGDERGQRISVANAFGRAVMRIISGLILCIGYIMVAFDIRKQGLHDKVANTVVYYG